MFEAIICFLVGAITTTGGILLGMYLGKETKTKELTEKYHLPKLHRSAKDSGPVRAMTREDREEEAKKPFKDTFRKLIGR